MQNLHNKKTLDLKEQTGTGVANRHMIPLQQLFKTLELFVPVFLMLTGTNEQMERKQKTKNNQITEQVKKFKKNCVVVTKP